MKKTDIAEISILNRAKRLGFLIQECLSFNGYYYIVDRKTQIVIAGAQDFLTWEEVVKWVLDADIPPTVH